MGICDRKDDILYTGKSHRVEYDVSIGGAISDLSGHSILG